MHQNLVFTFLGISSGICALLAPGPALAAPEGPPACRVVQQRKQVELCSPLFVFRLDTAAGLRARSWENRLTGRTLELGNGQELEIDVGLPDHPLYTPPLDVSTVRIKREGEAGEAVFTLAAKEPALSVLVTYRWNAKQPVLRKFVEIANKSDRVLDRLLNIRLGTYRTDARIMGREQGFPVYLDGEFFMSLAHPAGWATGANSQVSLRQYPGIKVASGDCFGCMETVYGVAQGGEASQAFMAHLRGRMRRVVRGHDKPYAIFESFGGKPNGDNNESEEYILENITKLAKGQREAGYQFDFYSLEFWVDYNGDLKRFDPKRFPNGFAKIRPEIARLGMDPALWIDSSWEQWSIGGNPAVQHTLNYDPKEGPASLPMGRKSFCRASEPIKSMYTEAFRHHIRHNGVRLLKFDNFTDICKNPNHEHLPGIYSTEPIVNAAIEFLRALDEECHDVFLMLYWGYRSPWWLLYADTLFDSGIGIEASSPSDLSAPYARDSVTQKLDQAQWVANESLPPLGKDSLGIWLSNWPWNSQIGKERWEAGFVMDICRGSLLAQPWTDTGWLSPPERKQMADFIALLKARPNCFGNPRFVLGNPWKNEPYGYCCTDGKRAFLALNNCCWRDSNLSLKLNSAWGLPDGRTWDLYRWYPDPARLHGEGAAFGEITTIAMRPFEVVLLEVVPQGQSPSLDRGFKSTPIPLSFAKSSSSIVLSVAETKAVGEAKPRSLAIQGQVPSSRDGGTLVVSAKMTKASNVFRVSSAGRRFLSAKGILDGQSIACQPVLGNDTYPSCWQAWRIAVESSAEPRPWKLEITTSLPPEVKLSCSGYFLPK